MTNGIQGLFIYILAFMNMLSGFIISLALLVFLWGIFKLVFYGKDSKEREAAKGYITWGIIALFTMVCVWGLVNLLTSLFGLGGAGVAIPQFPSSSGI